MSTAAIALLVSGLSLLLSAFALGWNIYRDVLLKARVKVSFHYIAVVREGETPIDGWDLLRLSVVNHGPGPVQVGMVHGRVAPLWRRLLRRVQHFVVLLDRSIPMNQRPMPERIEVGERRDYFLRPEKLMSAEAGARMLRATHIGIADSFDRVHYAPMKQLREARNLVRRNLPPPQD